MLIRMLNDGGFYWSDEKRRIVYDYRFFLPEFQEELAEEMPHTGNDIVDLFSGHLRIEREGDALFRRHFADGIIAFLVAKIGIGLLQVKRDRIVQRSRYPLTPEFLLKPGPLLRPDNKLVVDRLELRRLKRQGDPVYSVEPAPVQSRDFPPSFRPPAQILHFNTQDCALDAVHSVIVAPGFMHVLR